ncbi:MAG: hypothetical protein GX801_04195 [Fibrobacter sp.]|nr:hypothetical protein [Fibrobacter sp.]
MDKYFKKYLFLFAVGVASLLTFHFSTDAHHLNQILPKSNQYVKSFHNWDEQPSKITTTLSDSNLQVALFLQGETGHAPWVAVQINLWDYFDKHLNWMFVDTLFIDVESDDISELQVKILTFDPDLSNPKEYSTYKVLSKEIPLQKGRQKIGIRLEDFYIPEWWFAQKDKEKKFTSKHWEKVGYLELSTTGEAKTHQDLSYTIHSISVQETQKTHLKILLSILFILALIAIGLIPSKK